jgi:hypothetical protein
MAEPAHAVARCTTKHVGPPAERSAMAFQRKLCAHDAERLLGRKLAGVRSSTSSINRSGQRIAGRPVRLCMQAGAWGGRPGVATGGADVRAVGVRPALGGWGLAPHRHLLAPPAGPPPPPPFLKAFIESAANEPSEPIPVRGDGLPRAPPPGCAGRSARVIQSSQAPPQSTPAQVLHVWARCGREAHIVQRAFARCWARASPDARRSFPVAVVTVAGRAKLPVFGSSMAVCMSKAAAHGLQAAKQLAAAQARVQAQMEGTPAAHGAATVPTGGGAGRRGARAAAAAMATAHMVMANVRPRCRL